MSNIELSNSQSYGSKEKTSLLVNPVREIVVQFWGVRGLIPTPSSSNSRYGGNTACVELYVAGKHLIFDGGTGLRILGKIWQEMVHPSEAHLFFTNAQSNRIQGFPFFAPAFTQGNRFHIYGSPASNSASIKQSLCDQMLQPHFPYPLQVMRSELNFYNLIPSKTVELNDIQIQAAIINKYQRSVGYRINWGNYSIAYATDLHGNMEPSEQAQILQIIQGVDLLIANATYTPPTSKSHEAPESLWRTAVDLAQNNGVRQLVISHHHPDDDDEFLDKIQAQIKSVFPNSSLAYEGLVLPINK
jgi:phosphoribosyl 1,2-cyclic phosphodiesterase